MLVITRHPGESILINKETKIVVISVNKNSIKLGFDAPKDIEIYREEIAPKDWVENSRDG